MEVDNLLAGHGTVLSEKRREAHEGSE